VVKKVAHHVEDSVWLYRCRDLYESLVMLHGAIQILWKSRQIGAWSLNIC